MTDIWMIVTFMYPFIIIFMHTMLYVLNKNAKNQGRKEHNKAIWMLQFFNKILLPGMFILFATVYWVIAISHWMTNKTGKI